MNRTVLMLSAVLLGVVASAPAFAWRGGGVRFGVVVGAPFYPWYYPPYYYYPPYPYPSVAPAAPTTYVEQGGNAPSQRSSYWYYCEASKTYYPYVKECPAGWLRVVPQAPGG